MLDTEKNTDHKEQDQRKAETNDDANADKLLMLRSLCCSFGPGLLLRQPLCLQTGGFFSLFPLFLFFAALFFFLFLAFFLLPFFFLDPLLLGISHDILAHIILLRIFTYSRAIQAVLGRVKQTDLRCLGDFFVFAIEPLYQPGVLLRPMAGESQFL